MPRPDARVPTAVESARSRIRREPWEVRMAIDGTTVGNDPADHDDPVWRGKLRPPRVRVVLVRHGESTWNDAGILQGHHGPGLNERGAHQAQALAEELARR